MSAATSGDRVSGGGTEALFLHGYDYFFFHSSDLKGLAGPSKQRELDNRASGTKTATRTTTQLVGEWPPVTGQ